MGFKQRDKRVLGAVLHHVPRRTIKQHDVRISSSSGKDVGAPPETVHAARMHDPGLDLPGEKERDAGKGGGGN